VASHAAALKAHRQNVKRREQNRALRSKLRTALKDIRSALGASDMAGVKDKWRKTVSLIDKMASKGVIHDNAAARYKSRLQKQIAGKTQAA
jgi:small subunit ribosomal protein S20